MTGETNGALAADAAVGSYPVVTDVVTKLAGVLNEQAIDLPPLARSVDPDALERLVASAGDGSITIEHAGCEVMVTVTDEGYAVDVAPPTGRS